MRFIKTNESINIMKKLQKMMNLPLKQSLALRVMIKHINNSLLILSSPHSNTTNKHFFGKNDNGKTKTVCVQCNKYFIERECV